MFIFSLLFLWCWGHLCIMTPVNNQDYLMQLLFFFREHKMNSSFCGPVFSRSFMDILLFRTEMRIRVN
jgi:hypothetical protein